MSEQIKLIASRDMLAEALHTALRKLCDSTPSSLMWNLFHVITDQEVISDYYDVIWKRIKHGRFNTDFELAEAVRAAVLEDFDYLGHPDQAALHCAAELMHTDDWLGYVGYLVEYTRNKASSASRVERWRRQFDYLAGQGRLRLAPNQVAHLIDESMADAQQAEGVYDIAEPDQIQVRVTRGDRAETRKFPLDSKSARAIGNGLDAVCRRRAREVFSDRERPNWYAAEQDYVEQVMATFDAPAGDAPTGDMSAGGTA